MAKPRRFEVAGLGAIVAAFWLSTASSVQAQELLKDLIASRKQGMTLELQAAARPLAEQKIEALSSMPPRLWSLSGTQNDVVAEILWRGRVMRVPLRPNQPIAGPWRIQSSHGTAITIIDRVSGHVERLELPAMGTSISAYAPYFQGISALTVTGSDFSAGLLPPPPSVR